MRRPKPRRGIALMLVLAVVAVAAVMGYAMLSAGALQGVLATNTTRATAAEFLADSGVNLAAYYLMYPLKAPTLTNGYWAGGTGIGLGSQVDGTIDVSVTLLSSDSTTATYKVTSTGKAGGVKTAATPLSRNVVATLRVNSAFVVRHALGSNSSLTVNSRTTITGDVQTNGTLTIPSGAVVTGTATAKKIILLGSLTSSILLGSSQTVAVPQASDVKDYRTYAYQGKTYSAVLLTTDQTNVTLGVTAANPAGVYWAKTPITLKGGVTLNGTLYSTTDVYVQGKNNVINPRAGFPAVVANSVGVLASNQNMTINGLAYLTAGIWSLTTSTSTDVTVNGGLITDTAGVDITFKGSLNLKYVKANVAVSDLSTAGKAPVSVTVLAYGQ